MTDTVINDPTADQGPFRLSGTDAKRPGDRPDQSALPGSSEALQKLEALQAGREKDRAGYEKALVPQFSALDREQRIHPQRAETQKLGPAPDQADYQKNAMGFASAMAVLGAISSKFARVPGTAALNAFGGALKGWQEGNLQAYENGVKTWEENTKATIENNRQLIEKYDAAMKEKSMNIDQIASNIKMIAAQNHDKQMYDAASAQNFTLMGALRDKVYEYTFGEKGVDPAFQKLKKDADKNRAEMDVYSSKAANWVLQHGYNNADGTPMSPSDQLKYKAAVDREEQQTGKHSPKPLDAATQMYVDEGAAAGTPRTAQDVQAFQLAGKPPRSASGMTLADKRAEVLEKTGKKMTADEEQNFLAQQRGKSAEEGAVGQRAGAIAIAVQEANKTVPNVRALAEKNAGKGTAAWNALENKWKVQKGDAGFAQYVQQLNSLINLYGRVISGGGKGTVSDLEHAREMLNPNMPLSAVNGSLKGFETEIGIAEKAPEEVRRKMRGGDEPFAPAAAPKTGDVIRYDAEGNPVK